ncbi:glycosyltransferase family 2 protein [Lewinella sp. IMCC34183]|uniref:glycosyltransferase family 2 protein n=1 Tax=Lewinella sp. IMCC34183 TaxID=2248762 RepID=UPI001300786A|nr:glycosyltransferase family 2 protein [Lewinella sp. IMCC34183]
MQFTVIICTYERPALLEGSLRSLAEPEPPPDDCRLLIVDNAGTPEVRAIAATYGADYVHEPSVGLSHARNRGAAESETEWLVYLDDDIQAPPGLLRRFGERIRATDCAAFGGQYTHWFATPPPAWLRRYYAGPRRPGTATVYGVLPAGQYLIGCIMAIRRGALARVGGFDPALGMSGDRIVRGEDDHVQDKLRHAGFPVYYDPGLTLRHLVQPYKYLLGNRLALSYAEGRASATITPLPHGSRWAFLLRAAARVTFVKLPKNLARLLLLRGYYWQNAYLDTVQKYAWILGRFTASR